MHDRPRTLKISHSHLRDGSVDNIQDFNQVKEHEERGLSGDRSPPEAEAVLCMKAFFVLRYRCRQNGRTRINHAVRRPYRRG